MRLTETRVNFELINTQAQEDCTFTGSGNKSFGNLNLLNIQTKNQFPFMSLELNQGILNGSLSHFRTDHQPNITYQKVNDLEKILYDMYFVFEN